MGGAVKLVACVSILLASALFLSITVLERNQGSESLQMLSNDSWCRQRIAEAFPDFPVISNLGKMLPIQLRNSKRMLDLIWLRSLCGR